ncbi:cation-binding protein [Williamsia sp. 1138]|uniref:hemerythrin domain-containing protein n=1 Tax=Williamsia sp. 1138 TaxID=1903117 RepID=UPI000A111D55|nr:hemerythrin domain-containing protein [Williamsia sp. 1138]OZG29262.1 cation-binding protein [Williamsia sp. 1138]
MYVSLSQQSDTQLGGPRSVLTRQKRDHIELDRLISSIDLADGDERQELLTRLCRLVFPHAFAEESVLWPFIRRNVPDGEQLTLQIEQEHQEINERFTALELLDVDSRQHHDLFATIAELLREDVRDEEDHLLPRLQQHASAVDLVRLGLAWEAVRRSAPTRPHPVVARRPPGNVLAAAPLTILDRSRDRLDSHSRTQTRFADLARSASRLCARVAGRIEHLPPLTRGEDSSTHTTRSPGA